MKIASSIANFMCALYLKSNYLARSSIQIFFHAYAIRRRRRETSLNMTMILVGNESVVKVI